MVSVKLVRFNVTTQAAAFADGDQVGSIIELPTVVGRSGKAAIIRSITVLDKAKQSAKMDFLFFSKSPTNNVLTNGAADISDAEMAEKYIGLLEVGNTATPFHALNTNSVVTVDDVYLPVRSEGDNESTSIYVLCVSRGTPTYVGTSDLVVTLGVEC